MAVLNGAHEIVVPFQEMTKPVEDQHVIVSEQDARFVHSRFPSVEWKLTSECPGRDRLLASGCLPKDGPAPPCSPGQAPVVRWMIGPAARSRVHRRRSEAARDP